MPTTKTKGAVIVTRVSTGEQVTEGTSLGTQLATCLAKAQSLNLPVIATYEDAGISGSFLTLRSGMTAALADIQTQRADTLICATMSRYSRDTEHQQAIKKAVRAAGGKVVFCDMDFAETPEGDLAFGIMGSFAEYERKVIRERSMKGKRSRAESGIQPSRTLSPLGYHVVTRDDIIRGDYPFDQLGLYQILPEQAALVKRIFECYASGTHSLYALAREFNAERIPCVRGGAHWHAPTFRHIICNPVYKGQPAYGKRRFGMDEARLQEINPSTGLPFRSVRTSEAVPEAEWTYLSAPPIVSEEVWDRAQARSTGNKSRMGGNPAQIRMLSGRVRCPACGGSMQYRHQPGNKPADYCCGRYCSSKHSAVPEPLCVRTRYQVPIVEKAVISCMTDICEKPEAIAAEISAHMRKPAGETAGNAQRELASVTTALEEHTAQELTTVRAQIQGLMAGAPASAYELVFAELGEKRKALETRRDLLAKQVQASGRACEPETVMTPEDIKTEAIRNLHRVLTSEFTTGLEKRDLLALIVDEVIPSRNGAEVRFFPGVFRGTIQRMTIFVPTSVSPAAVSSFVPPPSTRTVRPLGVMISVLSPCPTSIAITRSFPASGSGRLDNPHHATGPSSRGASRRSRRREKSFFSNPSFSICPSLDPCTNCVYSFNDGPRKSCLFCGYYPCTQASRAVLRTVSSCLFGS